MREEKTVVKNKLRQESKIDKLQDSTANDDAVIAAAEND